MKTQSVDTHLLAESKLIELIKSKSTSQRLLNTLTLTSTALNLSKRAIRRANTGMSKSDLDNIFVEHYYGKQTAMKVKKYIKEMNFGKK
jgi:hypothetical protein